ncbi:hypothetical protein ACJMK2_027108 [Sinanodonta woodiana]|uniref:Uncharacterized protein n=1 Tax=Sinanodonta woodiana TaxID=1069815 RepID=A0ABD3XNF8_SINWO
MDILIFFIAAKIGEPCLNLTSRCVSLFSVCTEGTCRCRDSYVVSNDGRCKLPGTSFVGESCEKCEYPALCVGGVCRCADNYRPLAFDEYWVDPFSSHQCHPQGYTLNKCNGTEIPAPLSMQALTRSTSIYPDKEMSVKTQSAVFGSCTSHIECPKFSKCKPSSCDGFLCLCDSGFIASKDRSSCLRARRISEACNSLTDRCMSPFASCTNSFCKCLDIFLPTFDGRCKLPGNNFLGEPCLKSEQCEYPSKCINGSCLCVDPYRQITHEEFWMDPMITSQCRPLNFSVWKCNETHLDIPGELSSRQESRVNNRDVIPIDSSVRTTTEGYRSFSQFPQSNFIPKFLTAYDANRFRSTPLPFITQILGKPLHNNHSDDVSEPHNMISRTFPEETMGVRERSLRTDIDAHEYTTSSSRLDQNRESPKNTANFNNSSDTPYNGNLSATAQMNVTNTSFDQTRLIDRLSKSGILRLFDDRISRKFLIGSLANSSINGSHAIFSYSSTLPPKSATDLTTKGYTTLKNKADLSVDLLHTSTKITDNVKIPFLYALSQSTNNVINPVGNDATYLKDGMGYEKKYNNSQSTTHTSTIQDSFLKNTNNNLFLVGHTSHTTTFNPVSLTNPTSETNIPLPFKMPLTEVYLSLSKVPKGLTEVTSSTQTEAIKGNTIYSIPAQTGNSVLSTPVSSSQHTATLSSLQTGLEIPKRVATITSSTNEDNNFISDLMSESTNNEEIATHLPNDFIDTRVVPVEITNVGGNLFLTNIGGFSRMLDGMLTFDNGSSIILFTTGQSEISHDKNLLHTVSNMCLEVIHKQGKTSVIKRQVRAVSSYYGGTLSLMSYQIIHDNQTGPKVKGHPTEQVENASRELFWEILHSLLTPGNKTSIYISKPKPLSKDKRRVGKRNHNFANLDSHRDQTLLDKNDLIRSTQASTTMYSSLDRSLSATASLEQGHKNMTNNLRTVRFSIMEYVKIILPILQLIDIDTNVQLFSSDDTFVYFLNGKSRLHTDSGKVYVIQGGEQPMITIEVVGNVSVILESGILRVQLPHSSLNFDVNLTEVHFRNSSLFFAFNSSNFLVEVREGSVDIVQGNQTRTIPSNGHKIVLSQNLTKNIRMYSQHIVLKAELDGSVWTYHNVSHTTTYQKNYISYIENTNGRSEIRIGTLHTVLVFHGGGTDIVHINGSGLLIENMFDLLVENKYGTVEAEMTDNKQIIVLDQGITKAISSKHAIQVEQFNGTMCLWQEISFVRHAIEIMNKTEETSNVEDSTVPLSLPIQNPDNYDEVASIDASKQFVTNRSDSAFVTGDAMITSQISLNDSSLSVIDEPDLTSGDNKSRLVNITTETTSNMPERVVTTNSTANLSQPTFHDKDMITNMNTESKERGKHVEAREGIYAEPRLSRNILNNTLIHEIRNATARRDSNLPTFFATKISIETESSITSRNTSVNTNMATDNNASTADQKDVNGTLLTETVVAMTMQGDSNVVLARPSNLHNGMSARPVTIRTAHVEDSHSYNNGLNESAVNNATLYETNDSVEVSTLQIRRQYYTSGNVTEQFETSTNMYSEPNATIAELDEKAKLGLGFGQSSSAMREATFNATSETNYVHRNKNANNITVSFKRNSLSVTLRQLSDIQLEIVTSSDTYTKAQTADFTDTALEDVVTSMALTAANRTSGETTFNINNIGEQILTEPLSNSTIPYSGIRPTSYITETPSTLKLGIAEIPSTSTLYIVETPSSFISAHAETPRTFTVDITELTSTPTPYIAETVSKSALATVDATSISASATAVTSNTSVLNIAETPSTLLLSITETPSTITLATTGTPNTSTSTTAETLITSTLDIVETRNTSSLPNTEVPSTSTLTIPATAGTSTLAAAVTLNTVLNIAETPSTLRLSIAETPSTATVATAETPSTSTSTTAQTLSTLRLSSAETPSTLTITTAETPSTSTSTTAQTLSTLRLSSAETPSTSTLAAARTHTTLTAITAKTLITSTLDIVETRNSPRLINAEVPSPSTITIPETGGTSTLATAVTLNTSELNIAETPTTLLLYITETPSTSNLATTGTHNTSTSTTAETLITSTLDIIKIRNKSRLKLPEVPSTSTIIIPETGGTSTLATSVILSTSELNIIETRNTSSLTNAEVPSTSTITIPATGGTSTLATAVILNTSVLNSIETRNTSRLTFAEVPSTSTITTAETTGTSTLATADTLRIAALTTAKAPSISMLTTAGTPNTSRLNAAETPRSPRKTYHSTGEVAYYKDKYRMLK